MKKVPERFSASSKTAPTYKRSRPIHPRQGGIDRGRARNQDAGSAARKRARLAAAGAGPARPGQTQSGIYDVTAAQSGRVVKLTGAVGTFATPGQSLMMFVPDEVWVVANYKETQLTDMRPGQTVEFRIDAYPGSQADRPVASVQPGSGTASACCRRKTPPATM